MSDTNTESNPFGSPNAEEGGDDDEFVIPEEIIKDVPLGFYAAKLISLENKVSQAGNKMWVWVWALTKPIRQPRETEPELAKRAEHCGDEVTNYTALTAAAMFKLRETFAVLGIEQVAGAKLNKAELIGSRAILELEKKEYRGEFSANIKGMKAHPDGPKPTGDEAPKDQIPF